MLLADPVRKGLEFAAYLYIWVSARHVIDNAFKGYFRKKAKQFENLALELY